MRYRGTSSQCTDALPRELKEAMEASGGDGVKPDR